MQWNKLALGALLLFSASVWARSAGADPAVTGAPGDGVCTDCHTSTANAGPGKLQISLVNATTWTPGTPVTLRITLSDPTAQRWGFEITARSAATPSEPLGTLAVTDTANTQLKTAGSLQFITHRTPGTRPGTSGSSSWEVQWTPPSDASAGAVTFYAAGNAANNNGVDDSGDKIYTTSLTVSPAAANPDPTPTPTGTPRILSRLSFGSQADAGVWTTALYFYNPTDKAADVPVAFFGADGQPLSVASAGGDHATVSVPSKGTGYLEFNDGVSLTDGWVKALLPDGVTGFGVVKRTTDAAGVQEITLPLMTTTSAAAALVYDENQGDTWLSLINPTASSVDVAINARDDAGASIASATITLASYQRQWFLVRDRAEFAAIAGKRGVLEFSAASGAVSVLGQRTKGNSFAPVFPAER
ncbi:MAG: hypothetical protein HY821_16170 [Acidobacteria bacterium]|nr:hypothetical protein [Acidobacteriota bacterium]